MKKSASFRQKSRVGRTGTGIMPMIGVRASPALRDAIVRWAENQPDMPKLSEAIRRLVKMGLAVKQQRMASSTSRARASELAAQELDSQADAKASTKERDERKQRLLKGPSVFRSFRKDKST